MEKYTTSKEALTIFEVSISPLPVLKIKRKKEKETKNTPEGFISYLSFKWHNITLS